MIKNIVIIADRAINSGGASNIAINSAIKLSEKYKVYYFAGIKGISEELLSSNVEVICLKQEHIGETKKIKDLVNGIYNRKAEKELSKLLKKLNREETVIHIHGWSKCLSSSIFKAIKKFKYIPFVSLHDYFMICPNGGIYNYKKDCTCDIKPNSKLCFLCNCDKKGYIYKVYRVIRQIVQNKVLKNVKVNAIYVSNFSKKIMSKNMSNNFKINKEYVLKNFIELNSTQRVKVEENNYYLFIGRISEEKGIDKFLKIVDNYKLNSIVIGDGVLKKKYQARYKNVEFVGWITKDEMKKYLNKARSLLITTKLYETMGLTVLEMKNYGIPVIMPKNFAGTEFVKDRIESLYYDYNNESSIKEVIGLSKDDNVIKKLSINSFENFDRENYSILNYIRKLENIYNNGDEK